MTDAITSLEGAITSAHKTVKQFFDPNLSTDKQIPLELMENAKGLAFLTVVKAGFIWTGKVGTGLVISKLPDGRWSAPSAIGTAGMGFGAELGAEVIDFMIILSSEAAVKSFMQKGQLSGGLNMEFAAGPYGRAAGANANISSQGVSPNYTYSHSKGLFGGVGLQGSAIAARSDLNKKFYGREITPTEILTGAVEQPAAAQVLYDALQHSVYVREETRNSRTSSSAGPTEQMPGAATGSDVQIVYDKVISMIQTIAGGAAVTEFKSQCKSFGQDDVSAEAFITYLRQQFTKEQLVQLLPDIVRLLSQEQKRHQLWKLYTQVRSEVADSSQAASTPSLF